MHGPFTGDGGFLPSSLVQSKSTAKKLPCTLLLLANPHCGRHLSALYHHCVHLRLTLRKRPAPLPPSPPTVRRHCCNEDGPLQVSATWEATTQDCTQVCTQPSSLLLPRQLDLSLESSAGFATKQPLLLIAYFPCGIAKTLKEPGQQVQYQPTPQHLS